MPNDKERPYTSTGDAIPSDGKPFVVPEPKEKQPTQNDNDKYVDGLDK